MTSHTPSRMLASVLVVAAAIGCASVRSAAHAPTVCYPRQCALHVQNDYDRIIGVRYYDSTGAGDRLGSVRGKSVERFDLGVRTSRKITVEVSHDGQLFRSLAMLSPPPSENLIHFPTDFRAIASR